MPDFQRYSSALDWIKFVFRNNDKDNSIMFSQTIVNRTYITLYESQFKLHAYSPFSVVIILSDSAICYTVKS